MSLNTSDLFRLELRIRAEADRIRRRWPDDMLSDPTVPPETQTHARTQRGEADDFDQIGNLLCGLQGDWERLGPLVREGYLRQRRDFEEREAAAREAKKDEAA